MLKTHLRATALAAVCVALFAPEPVLAEKQPEKKHWEELRDKPRDYARFEQRRAENLKLGASTATRALQAGYATAADLGSMPVVTDEAVVRGLAVEAKKLLPEKLGIKGPPIEFVLVDDLGLYAAAQAAGQDNAAVQAILAQQAATLTMEAKSGGAIVIGLSALKVTRSYDELDFFLAHEMSHILYDHFSELERRERNTKILGIGILIASLATRRGDADTREAVAWSSVGLIVANALIGAAWDREQEYEADGLGYELLLESGMSAEGAVNVLEKLQQREDAQKVYLDTICGTDSVGDTFLKGLLRSATGIQIPPGGHDPNNPICAERRDLLAALLRDHPKVKDRKEEVDDHHKKFYAALSPRQPTGFSAGQSSVLEFLSPNGDASRMTRAYDGITAFHRGDLATARNMARAVSTRGKDEVLVPVLELNFYVANADGKRAEALQYLEAATRAPQASDRIFDLAVSEYERDLRWDKAASVLEFRMRRLGDRERTLPHLIRDLRLAGQKDRMEKYYAECLAMNSPGLTLACEASAHPPQPDAGAPPPTR